MQIGDYTRTLEHQTHKNLKANRATLEPFEGCQITQNGELDGHHKLTHASSLLFRTANLHKSIAS